MCSPFNPSIDMSHHIRIIQRHAQGYVAQCIHCQRYYLAFGTTALTFTASQLRHFQASLSQQIRHWKGRIPPQEKGFFFDTEASSVKIILCYQEMEAWCELLAKAMLLIQAEEMIQD